MVKPKNIQLAFPGIIIQFLAEVEFGMPSKECRNFGICRISPLRWEAALGQKKSVAILTVMEGNQIEMDFLRAFLCPYKQQKFLSKNTFLVKEVYHFISPEHQDYNFSINKGLHPIQERGGMISVTFNKPNF